MINDFKDLERLFKLCRKNGVYEIDLHGVKLKLTELPTENNSNSVSLDSTNDPRVSRKAN